MTDDVRFSRATHSWPTVPLPCYIKLSLGNGTMFRVALAAVNTHAGVGLFVGVENYGCYLMPNIALHPDYVGKKLGVRYPSDAAALTDFINRQQGHAVPLFANYDPKFMELAP